MAYKALYLTYRPQTFEEVAGQRMIIRTLQNAIAMDKIGHAYLFAGPRGTGKTSMARLFAKALNCEEGLGKQCNKCSNCLAISEGTHPDVVEIDAASNNGIDQVRDLIERVRYAPIKGRYKVYIIDEVHMMSTGAFNALLKTLEEPPEHVVFILATTEPYKVLPTILSRCQRFDFEKLDDADIRDRMTLILTKEKVTYDEKAVDAIISLADGGMRDALSILDQVLAYSGNKLNEPDVLSLFGLASLKQKIELLNAIKGGDISAVLTKFEEFLSGGIDIKRLSASLLDILKDILIYDKTHEQTLLTSIDEQDAIQLETNFDSEYANRMIDILLKSQIDFKNVSNVRSLFELTLLQLASLPNVTVQQKTISQSTPIVSPKQEKTKELIKNTDVSETKKAQFSQNTVDKQVTKTAEKTSPVISLSSAVINDGMNGAPTDKVIESAISSQAVAAPNNEAKENPSTAVEAAVKSTEAPVIANLDTKSIKSTNIAAEGQMFKLEDETIIGIMVLGNKEERYEFTKKWSELDPLKDDPKFGILASLLAEGHPFCLCKEALLLNFKFTRQRDRANVIANQEPIQEMVAAILGRRVFVYAMDRIENNRVQTDYFSLLQLNKLPKKEEIVLKLPVMEAQKQ